MDSFLEAAVEEARQGMREGGIPIGSVLVHTGKVIGRGHNRRVQKRSALTPATSIAGAARRIRAATLTTTATIVPGRSSRGPALVTSAAAIPMTKAAAIAAATHVPLVRTRPLSGTCCGVSKRAISDF